MFSNVPIDLILALVLAAAAGWFGSQIFRRAAANTGTRPRTEPFSTQYFAGLNHLLNEQPDKALEVLRGLAEADAGTVETQLALGHLYRRRGEVDRAIRVHESVMQRADLPSLLREQAEFALGEDYLKAGLLDRAENYFQQLIERPAHRSMALRNLLNIYEQQGDWHQAIATFQRLAEFSSPEHPTALAHYYCELADQAQREGQATQAGEWLDKAFAVQRNFPRGSLLRAGLALAHADARTAALLCKRVIELHPHLLPIVLPRYIQALRAFAANMDSVDESLSLHTTEPAQRAALGYAAIAANVFDEPYLLQCLPDFLRQDANLGDMVMALAGEPVVLDEVRLGAIASALSKIFRRTQRYRCVSCGVNTGSHFWQCPGCHSWDTLAPVSRLELAPVSRRNPQG
ncbi:MAG: tetratricopeptide repeat protein [Steroidobacteraceae bacterium]